MISLSQSAFLQALGWAIANSLWQMALLWGVYQLGFSVFRKATASVRTTAATLCLFGGFIWFLSSLMNHYWQVRAGSSSPGALVYAAGYSAAATIAQGHSFRFYIDECLRSSALYLPYLSFAYLLVLAFLLVRVVKAYRHVREVRFEGLIKMEARWRVYVEDLARRIGITREVKVWLSEKIDIPATIGYLKPLILVPVASFNHLTPEQVEAIILHELAHIKRNDYLLNLVVTVVETILFFNPFAQLITRHIKTERENSCDDFVLQFRYNPHEYASALLSLEQQRRVPELAMMASGKTDLLDRIKRIMNVQTKPMNYGQKLVALLITAGILGSLAWLTPSPNAAPRTTPPLASAKSPVSPAPAIAVSTSVRTVVKPVPVPARLSVKAKSTSCGARECTEDRQSAEFQKRYPEVGQISPDDKDITISIPSGLPAPAPEYSGEAGQEDALTMETDVHLPELMKLAFKARFNILPDGRKTKTKQPKEDDPTILALRQAYLAEAAAVDQNNLDSARRAFGRLMRERNTMLRDKDLALLRRLQLQVWNRKAPAIKISVLKKNAAAKTTVRIQTDEDDVTGIKADQPGWQDAGDANETTSQTISPKAAIIPTAYVSNRTVIGYKERITVSHARAGRSSIGDFLQKLAGYGILPEDKVLRITKDGNTLLINDKIQPRAVYSLFRSCFSGENVVIIQNGEVVQITIN